MYMLLIIALQAKAANPCCRGRVLIPMRKEPSLPAQEGGQAAFAPGTVCMYMCTCIPTLGHLVPGTLLVAPAGTRGVVVRLAMLHVHYYCMHMHSTLILTYRAEYCSEDIEEQPHAVLVEVVRSLLQLPRESLRKYKSWHQSSQASYNLTPHLLL